MNHASPAEPDHPATRCGTEPLVFVVESAALSPDALARRVRSLGWDVRAYAGLDEFLATPPALVASCLVIEANATGCDSLALQERIAFDRPGMPIVLTADVSHAPAVLDARTDATAQVLQPAPRDDVLERAIEIALERSRPAIAQWGRIRDIRERYTTLSRREREVMALVVAGRLNKQVGGDLGISEITVKAHRGSLMRKMRAPSLAGLVTMAAHLGLSLPTADARQ